MIKGIDHVQMTAPPGSEDELRRFYCVLLGLREIPKPVELQSRGGLWLDCGNMQLHFGIDRHELDLHLSRRHVALKVDDLEKVQTALREAGCEIENDAASIPGVKRFYTRDPAGNRVEFVQEL